MPEASQPTTSLRFGPFELFVESQELRKNGIRLKLSGQAIQVLVILLDQPGRLVSREELQQKLWPGDSYGDFEHGLNAAVNRLRETLGDSANTPKYIETLPRRGYRFIAPLPTTPATSDQPATPVPSSVPISKATPLYYGVWASAAVIVLGGALVLWKTLLQPPRAPRVLRFTQLTNDGQVKIGLPGTDGSRIYFTEVVPGPRNIIVQVSVKGGEAVPLSVPLKKPWLLDLSRDGSELLIESGDQFDGGSLWVQPVAGGSPHRVGNVLVHDARFGPDETRIFYSIGHDIYSVGSDGSSPRKLITVPNAAYSLRFSPDARVLRFTQSNYWHWRDSMTIVEASADGTVPHALFPGCCGKWTPDGRFFVFQSASDRRIDLWAFPEKRAFRWRKPGDKPFQLTAGPVNFVYPLPSADGKQVFAIGGSPRAEVIRYDSRTGQFVPYLSGISAEGLAFSRDGLWVAYTSFPDGTLWRSKVDGSERLQLTFPPLRVLLPRWSPDGRQIAFNAMRPGETFRAYLLSRDGGTPEQVLPGDQSQMDVNWSPDGSSLVLGTHDVPDSLIYTVDLRSKRVSTLPGSAGLFSPRWSPDGHRIAAITSNEPQKLMLFDLRTQMWIKAYNSEMAFPTWSRDGKYIYFWSVAGQESTLPDRVTRLRLSDLKLESIVEVKNIGRLTTGTIIPWLGLAPDDSPLFARDISTSEVYALDMDWP